MFDRMKQALGIAGQPEPPRMPGTALVPVPVVRAEPERPQVSMGYLDRHPDSPRPAIQAPLMTRSFDLEARIAHTPVAAAVRHLMTQSGFLSYGVELNCSWISGQYGLEPAIAPNAEKLGWNDAFAKTWAAALDAAYHEWADHAESCDSHGRLKWAAMQSAAVKSYLATGDIIATLDYGEKPGSTWKTSINLLDPSRLWTPPMWQYQTTQVVRDGIEFDARGRALAYHIRPPTGVYTGTIAIPTYSREGKKLLCHTFDGEPATIRGVSPLGSAIGAIMQSMQAHDAAVLAAHIAAQIVGVVTSDLPSDTVAKSIGGPEGNPLHAMQEHRVQWHETLKKADAHLRLGHGGRIVHLSTGEKFELFAGKTSFTEYEKIIRLGLAEAARGLGLAPEHLHGLKDGATYSSLKVAATEARAIMGRRRSALIEPLCEFGLWSLAEEMIADGRLPWPAPHARWGDKLADFRKRRHLIRVEWRGPSIEDPDVLKATRAAIERVRWGLSSHTDEIGAMGKDAETVFRNRAADRDAMDALGLTLPWPNEPKGGSK